MKNLLTTALVTMVTFYVYSQDGVHLPLTGGTLTGQLNMTLPGNGSATFTNGSNTFGQIRLNNSLVGGKVWELQSYSNGSLYFNNQVLQPVLLLNDDKTINLFGTLIGTSATFGGTLKVGNAINLNGGVGSYREISFRTNDALRWDLYADPTSETGSDVGSNLSLASYNDAGEHHRNIFTANRSTGNIAFSNDLSINGTLTGTSGTFSGKRSEGVV